MHVPLLSSHHKLKQKYTDFFLKFLRLKPVIFHCSKAKIKLNLTWYGTVGFIDVSFGPRNKPKIHNADEIAVKHILQIPNNELCTRLAKAIIIHRHIHCLMSQWWINVSTINNTKWARRIRCTLRLIHGKEKD